MSDQATILKSIICFASIFTSLRPQRCTALVTERQILSCRRYHIYRRVNVEGGPDSFFEGYSPGNLCTMSGHEIVETRFEINKSSRPALPDMVGVDLCAWDLVKDMERYLAKHMKKWRFIGRLKSREEKIFGLREFEEVDFAVLERVRRCKCRGKLNHKAPSASEKTTDAGDNASDANGVAPEVSHVLWAANKAAKQNVAEYVVDEDPWVAIDDEMSWMRRDPASAYSP